MKYIPSILMMVLLGGTSAALIVMHVRAWKRLALDQLDDRAASFHRRQFRRRMQSSAMIGLLGVAILVGQLLLDVVKWPNFNVFYWIGVLALLLWIVLLAVADMVATSAFYSRERTDFALQHAKLQAELRQARKDESRKKGAHGHNGKPGDGH